jgi:hypothetical protein
MIAYGPWMCVHMHYACALWEGHSTIRMLLTRCIRYMYVSTGHTNMTKKGRFRFGVDRRGRRSSKRAEL